MILAADRTRSLGEHVLQAFEALAPAGGYRFTPSPRGATDPTNPRDPDYDGVRDTIEVSGVPVARGSSDGASYCCGITFACWWEALARAGCPRPDDAEDVLDLVSTWFCPTMGHSGVVDALVARGWGEQVPVEEARPGDLVQYWRRTDLARPSGHSAIWLALDEGVLRYASSQPATDGVGRHQERVGEGWRIHVVRPWFLREDGAQTRS
jgi:hypothetical protein